MVVGDHHANPAVENEMHGFGDLARAQDDFAGFDLEPFAAADQFDGVLLGAENLGEQPRKSASSWPRSWCWAMISFSHHSSA